jgi:hypothetical protein
MEYCKKHDIGPLRYSVDDSIYNGLSKDKKGHHWIQEIDSIIKETV